MLLSIHIVAALAGLICAGAAALFPSPHKIRLSGASVLLTFISGFGLIAARHATLSQICLSGLSYLAIVLPMIYVSIFRLARSED